MAPSKRLGKRPRSSPRQGRRPLLARLAAHTSRQGYPKLETTGYAMGLLYNLIVHQYNFNTGRLSRKTTGQELTQVLKNEPEFQGYAHKLATGVEQRAHASLQAYFNYLRDLKDNVPTVERGKPHPRNPLRNRTLEISEPAVKHL